MKIKNVKNKLVVMGSSAIVAVLPVASSAVGTSLLTTEVSTMITGFAENVVPTVLGMLTILVPVGLTLWAVGFGVKKGIAFLQKKASKAI